MVIAASRESVKTETRQWLIAGRVQAVGFRPFVYRLAHRHRLHGWVRNDNGHVVITAAGSPDQLQAFASALLSQAPPLARPVLLQQRRLDPLSFNEFAILPSVTESVNDRHVAPDYFLCEDCRRELFTAGNRRYRYPFINCTQCGPRYTLMTAMPYDRSNTTLADFRLCRQCREEFNDPLDRRFHAAAIACPQCGPELLFSQPGQPAITDNETALHACISAIRRGDIVAVKGIGGYHLVCDAGRDDVIARLRRCKQRPYKPFAVMFPDDAQLQCLRGVVIVNDEDEKLLREPARSIVMLTKKAPAMLPESIAPGLNEIGVMLPYSPLHHLLLAELARPLIATSANRHGEPVISDNTECENLLTGIADAFLHHNRPIQRPADDAVVRRVDGCALPIRLGRGTAPVEMSLPFTLPCPLLAVGGHLKNTIALAWQNRVVVSPHLGDQHSPRSQAAFVQTAQDLQDLYGIRAHTLVCDAHPDYATSRWARRSGKAVIQVWHHHAHAAGLAVEYPQVRRWLVFAWDGLGLGPDNSLWGGEALLGRPGDWQRVATFRRFHLPGGERASREPWRSALALCWQAGLDWPACRHDTRLLYQAWQRRLQSPPCTAVGRLFDAAAALLGLVDENSYEGQAPMYLEAVASPCDSGAAPLPRQRHPDGLWVSDWKPLLHALLDDRNSVARRSALFHETLAQTVLAQARQMRCDHGEFSIGLSGGVFQNKLLTERVCRLLRDDAFDVCQNRQVPCNDAGLSVGQIIEAASHLS